jgi:hypothetical protein
MSAADKTKMDGIEASATADQTAAEIRTLVESATDSNVFTDADHTKLNAIEASADVTDTANVTAAGALMTTGGTLSGNVTITTADNSQQLSLISTDADANVGPELHLRRNSNSPANNDAAGEISFNANNDAGQNTNIVSVDTKILNVADGTEEGGLELRTMKAGAMRSRINMYGSTTVINDDSQDIDFRVESDGNANMLVVDAGNDRVGIGLAAPAYTLDIHGVTAIKDAESLTWQGGAQLSSAIVGSGSANTLKFWTSQNERVRILSGGDFHAVGNIVAYSSTISDPRLKENVAPVTDALDKVEQLTGYTFTYKPDGVASAGVMSTDVRSVLPSAVKQSTLPLKTGDDETPYDIVQYDQLHALLIEAVKELSQRVRDLENGTTS